MAKYESQKEPENKSSADVVCRLHLLFWYLSQPLFTRWFRSHVSLGYLAGQWPAGYLMQRLPIGKVLSFTTFGIDSPGITKHPSILLTGRSVGGHPHHDPSMFQLCWHCSQ